MKVKNEEELANILGMAFASYANKVQNGLTSPFKSFLTGQDSVDVKISLTPDGSINMLSIDPIVEFEAVESIAPIEPPVLEATEEAVNPIAKEMLTTEIIEKPKRKRKPT
jgi:hypothetical protein